jgi:hypothetical protein
MQQTSRTPLAIRRELLQREAQIAAEVGKSSLRVLDSGYELLNAMAVDIDTAALLASHGLGSLDPSRLRLDIGTAARAFNDELELVKHAAHVPSSMIDFG